MTIFDIYAIAGLSILAVAPLVLLISLYLNPYNIVETMWDSIP